MTKKNELLEVWNANCEESQKVVLSFGTLWFLGDWGIFDYIEEKQILTDFSSVQITEVPNNDKKIELALSSINSIYSKYGSIFASYEQLINL